jgi:uncharacterized glyoxalase superfamily protein PhnB
MPLHREGIRSSGRSNEDAQLERESADRLDGDRRVDDNVGGVPPASGLRVRHAEVRVGDGVVMLADAAPDWPAVPAHVHIYVPDVDAAYQRALAAGAVSVQEPAQQGDEDRRCGVRDAGTTWWLGHLKGKTHSV